MGMTNDSGPESRAMRALVAHCDGVSDPFTRKR